MIIIYNINRETLQLTDTFQAIHLLGHSGLFILFVLLAIFADSVSIFSSPAVELLTYLALSAADG